MLLTIHCYKFNAAKRKKNNASSRTKFFHHKKYYVLLKRQQTTFTFLLFVFIFIPFLFLTKMNPIFFFINFCRSHFWENSWLTRCVTLTLQRRFVNIQKASCGFRLKKIFVAFSRLVLLRQRKRRQCHLGGCYKKHEVKLLFSEKGKLLSEHKFLTRFKTGLTKCSGRTSGIQERHQKFIKYFSQ